MSAVLASLVLTLQWCDPHELFQHGWANIEVELNRIVQPLDLAAHLEKDGGRIQVVLVKTEPAPVSTTAWDGDRLTITTRHPFQNPDDGRWLASTVTQTLWLQPASGPRGSRRWLSRP